jgi:hypothetical protein
MQAEHLAIAPPDRRVQSKCQCIHSDKPSPIDALSHHMMMPSLIIPSQLHTIHSLGVNAQQMMVESIDISTYHHRESAHHSNATAILSFYIKSQQPPS